MSDTPRTDWRIVKMLSDLQSGTMDVVFADFARELERENAALKHDIERHLGIAAKEAARAEAAEQRATAAERERDELNNVLLALHVVKHKKEVQP